MTQLISSSLAHLPYVMTHFVFLKNALESSRHEYLDTCVQDLVRGGGGGEKPILASCYVCLSVGLAPKR